MLLLAGPVVVFGAFLAPGVLDVLDAAGEADAVAWRTLWVLPLPAMVGLVVTAGRPGVRAAPVVSAVVVLALLLVVGTPITSSANRGTELAWPPVVDLPRPEVDSARTLVYLAPLGGTVAGPEDVDLAVAVLGVDVRPVNPRAAYLRRRHPARRLHPLRPSAHRPAQLRVVTSQVPGVEQAVRRRHRVSLNRHGRVVKHHRQNRQPRPHPHLEVQPRHPERRVSHKIHAELRQIGRAHV